MTLAEILARTAADAPGRTALRVAGRARTYGALAEAVEAAASLLRRRFGIGRGDRVAVLALNGPDTLVLLYACAKLGAILLPLNWRLAPAELAWILDDAEPRLLAADPAFAALGAELAGRSGIAALPIETGAGWPDAAPVTGDGRPDSPVLLVYTSGTTGRPKGALLDQEALVANAAMSRHMHDLTRDDHVLAVLPFFHVGGLNIQVTAALALGAAVTIHPRFEPGETLRAIAADRPSLLVLVPSTVAALLGHPDFAATDLSSLRAVTTGSTFVPQAVMDALEARGIPVLQVYGATETAPVAIYTRLGGARPRAGSAGWPGLLCDAKVADAAGRELPHGQAGEVMVRGPQVFSGYWRNAPATRDALVDGWFRTGDIATRDRDGAFFIHDRKTNVIISGGENVYPAEVERVLLSCPAVAEAAVIGRADPRWGEVPVAFVLPRPGAVVRADELDALVRSELAGFKAPRAYTVVDDLPRTALGKVRHGALKISDLAAGAALSADQP